jgi:hypothetical protein
MLTKHEARKVDDGFIAEKARLKAAVDLFAGEMFQRLAIKLAEGWQGWDDPSNAEELYRAMLAHGAAIPLARGQEPDIANFAMFLWYHRTQSRPPAPETAPTPPDPQPAAPGAVVANPQEGEFVEARAV